MDIFTETQYLDPTYQHLEKYVNIMYKGFWTPAKYEKLIASKDAPYFFNEMGSVDQEAIKRCAQAIALVEDKVKIYWCSLCLDLPQTIISDVGGLFAQSEVTHRRSYHSLLENLKINLDDIKNKPVIQGRIDYLSKYIKRDPKITGNKRVLKKLVLFTSLVERASLFTQFYILMSYGFRNRGLETISALQESTATEELVHYSFGMDLINIIKEQHPYLWESYLIELVSKNLKSAFDTEINLIDWFFEQGVPEHLSKEEVVNFLQFNFSEIAKDLELDLSFPYCSKIYNEKNLWMMEKIKTSTDGDFFQVPVGGYSSLDTIEDTTNFNW